MRGCWNRQTGTFEVRVSNGVGVQVPSLAPKLGDRLLPISQFLYSVGGLNPRNGFAVSQVLRVVTTTSTCVPQNRGSKSPTTPREFTYVLESHPFYSAFPKLGDRLLPISQFLCSIGGRRTRKDRNAVFSQGFALSQTYDWHKLGAKPVQSPR